MMHNGSVRTCIGCMKKGEKTTLVRFIFKPDAGIRLDKTQGMPGRGAYVCRDMGCLLSAWKKKAFVYALKIPPSQQGMLSLKMLYRLKKEMEILVFKDEGRSREGDLNEQA